MIIKSIKSQDKVLFIFPKTVFIKYFTFAFRVLKPPGGTSSIFSDDTSSCGSSVDSRSSSASPKTPAKTYKMASSFELSDEQPPEANRLRRPFKPSGRNLLTT